METNRLKCLLIFFLDLSPLITFYRKQIRLKCVRMSLWWHYHFVWQVVITFHLQLKLGKLLQCF